jgi:hypothetical protein
MVDQAAVDVHKVLISKLEQEPQVAKMAVVVFMVDSAAQAAVVALML